MENLVNIVNVMGPICSILIFGVVVYCLATGKRPW